MSDVLDEMMRWGAAVAEGFCPFTTTMSCPFTTTMSCLSDASPRRLTPIRFTCGETLGRCPTCQRCYYVTSDSPLGFTWVYAEYHIHGLGHAETDTPCSIVTACSNASSQRQA